MARVEIQHEDLLKLNLIRPNMKKQLKLAAEIANHPDFQDAIVSGSTKRSDFVMRSLGIEDLEDHLDVRVAAGLAVMRKLDIH